MSHLTREFRAFIAPFVVFMLFLASISFFDGLRDDPTGAAAAKYWIFPLQTIVCGAIMWWFWPVYRLKAVTHWVFTIFIAVLVLVIWISPQALFGVPPRIDGFDPTVFAHDPVLYYGTLAFRFLRLVVAVPLLEEIFWRGFLLRDAIHPRFTEVKIGTFSWKSFAIVVVAFGLAHWGVGPAKWLPGPDFVPALLTSALYNVVAYRTKSLSACVVAHAITNLLLGIYIMQTRQWGFW